MGRKTTPEQQHALSVVGVTTDDLATAKRALKQQIEDEFERRFDDLKRRRSRAVNEALALGATKTQISRAVGTSDWPTINAIIAFTQDEFNTPATESAPSVELKASDGSWTFNTVTLTAVFHHWLDAAEKWRDEDRVVLGQMRSFPNTPESWYDVNDGSSQHFNFSWLNEKEDEIRRAAGYWTNADPIPVAIEEPEEDFAAQMWATPLPEDEEEKEDW